MVPMVPMVPMVSMVPMVPQDQLECTQCEYESIKKENLQRHMLRNHKSLSQNQKNQEFQCNECTYKFLKGIL